MGVLFENLGESAFVYVGVPLLSGNMPEKGRYEEFLHLRSKIHERADLSLIGVMGFLYQILQFMIV
jgi:hypothetical protein